MHSRKQYLAVFYGCCVVYAIVLTTTLLALLNSPTLLARVIILESFLFFVVLLSVFQYFRKRQSPSTSGQKSKAANNAQRVGWFFIAAPILGLLMNGKQTASVFPHGLGLLIPLIPLSIGIYYLRLAVRLKAAAVTATEQPSA
jgi:hypothetical protein